MIYIKVYGAVNSGKSTVIEHIRNSLEKEGFKVILGDKEVMDGEYRSDLSAATEHLKNMGLTICIDSEHIKRVGLNDR